MNGPDGPEGFGPIDPGARIGHVHLKVSDLARSLDFYRDLPEGEWPREEDGSLIIYTRPLDLEPIRAAAAGQGERPAGVAPATAGARAGGRVRGARL